MLAALSRLALEHPEIAEVDVNPLFAGPSGVAAADALIVLRSAERLTEQVHEPMRVIERKGWSE